MDALQNELSTERISVEFVGSKSHTHTPTHPHTHTHTHTHNAALHPCKQMLVPTSKPYYLRALFAPDWFA